MATVKDDTLRVSRDTPTVFLTVRMTDSMAPRSSVPSLTYAKCIGLLT